MGSYVTFTTFMNHCKETSITQLSIKDIRGSVFLQKRRRAAFSSPLLRLSSTLSSPLLSALSSTLWSRDIPEPLLTHSDLSLESWSRCFAWVFFPGVRFTPKGCSWQHSLDKRVSRDHLSDRLASSKSMMKELKPFSFWTRLCKNEALFFSDIHPSVLNKVQINKNGVKKKFLKIFYNVFMKTL